MCPSSGRAKRGDGLGVRVRRAGAEQQTVGDRHTPPTLPGPCSDTRPASGGRPVLEEHVRDRLGSAGSGDECAGDLGRGPGDAGHVGVGEGVALRVATCCTRCAARVAARAASREQRPCRIARSMRDAWRATQSTSSVTESLATEVRRRASSEALIASLPRGTGRTPCRHSRRGESGDEGFPGRAGDLPGRR